MKTEPSPIKSAIIVISDRAARGERPDSSGPALENAVCQLGWIIAETVIIPDEFDKIVTTLSFWAQNGIDVILTTGGTGFSPRDITPEATLQVIDRLAPGLAEKMRYSSMAVTPHAMLSRAVAGIKGATLIVNLPGSPKGAVENLSFIQEIIPHAVELLRGDPSSETGHGKV